MEKTEKQILELVNASAQEWQTEEESIRLLKMARDYAKMRNKLLSLPNKEVGE